MLIGDVDREIISLFSEDIAAFYSINQIAKRLGKKYPYINKRVSALIGQGILNKSVLGNTYLCSINLASDSAVMLLSLAEIERRERAAAKDPALRQLAGQIKELATPGIICALICEKRLVVVGDNREAERQLPKIKGVALSWEDSGSFAKRLTSEEIARKHIILYGFEGYFRIVRGVEGELRARQLQQIQ